MNKNTDRLVLYFLILGDEFKKVFNKINSCPCSLRDMKIIQYLSTGPKTMSELAEFMNLTAGSMTSAIDSLIKDKFVKRNFDKNDRRKINILLTQKGENIAKMLHEKHYEVSNKILDTISKKEQEIFLDLLEKITQKLE